MHSIYLALKPLRAGVLLFALLIHPGWVRAAPEAADRVPLAAQALANRLGLHSAPVVGDQPQGSGRPWTVWFPRIIKPGSVGPGNVPRRYLYANGPALFTGPRGALGEFHYFDSSPLSRFGADTYRGPPLTQARAVAIALR
jgi:hypothetical protein